jgi:hypothetical protein
MCYMQSWNLGIFCENLKNLIFIENVTSWEILGKFRTWDLIIYFASELIQSLRESWIPNQEVIALQQFKLKFRKLEVRVIICLQKFLFNLHAIGGFTPRTLTQSSTPSNCYEIQIWLIVMRLVTKSMYLQFTQKYNL